MTIDAPVLFLAAALACLLARRYPSPKQSAIASALVALSALALVRAATWLALADRSARIAAWAHGAPPPLTGWLRLAWAVDTAAVWAWPVVGAAVCWRVLARREP